jgi:hypothetical protein
MPSVNGVGEPCAGEPHARFEAAGAGNGADALRHRASPRPYKLVQVGGICMAGQVAISCRRGDCR